MHRTAAILLFLPTLIGCWVLPSHPRTLLAQGISYLEQENYWMADLLLVSALRADSLLDDAWYYRGLSFADQDEPDAADSCLSRAIALNAVHRSALFTRGQLRLRRGNTEGAMWDFSEITFLYPALPDGYRGRAWVLEHLGRIEDAIDEWGLAIDRAPDNARLYEERGFALLDIANAESAVVDFSRALLIDPLLPGAYAGRGEARYRLGLFSLAIADCDSALGLDDEDADAWLTRGRSADDSGQFETAVISFQRFLQLVPESDPDTRDVRLRLRSLGH